MAGRFCRHRGASLLAVLCILLIIERVVGHPRSRPNYLSYDENHSLPGSSGKNDAAPSSVSEIFVEDEEMKPVDYSEPLTTYRRGTLEISREEGAGKGFGNEDEDLDDTEINDDRTDKRNGMENIEPDDDKYDNTETHDSIDDVIKRLLYQAIEERIFLTPAEWQLRAGGPNETESQVDDDDDSPVRMPFLEPSTAFLDNVADVPVPTCRDATFCADVPYYPSDEFIENALRMNNVQPISDPSMISQRMGPGDATRDDVPERSLCASRPEELEPVSGEDDQQEWHYVLNNKKYVQKVNVELCKEVGGSCDILDPLIVPGYKTFCKQTHFYKHLVVISKNGTAQTKPIKLPSSCCCHVKFNADPLSRLGVASLRNNEPQTPVLPARRVD